MSDRGKIENLGTRESGEILKMIGGDEEEGVEGFGESADVGG